MKLSNLVVLLPFLAALPASSIWAQSSADHEAEIAWARVKNPIAQTAAAGGTSPSVADRQKAALASIAFLREQARLAREFSERYPNHRRSAEAKKVEVLALVRAASAGDRDSEAPAFAAVEVYRKNGQFGSADRCEVALAGQRLALAAKSKDTSASDGAKRSLKLASELTKEFGEQPSVHEYLADTALEAEPTEAIAIANDLANRAQGRAKRVAAGILRRGQKIGTPAQWKFASLAGPEIDLSESSPKGSVVVIWSANTGPTPSAIAARFAGLVPADVPVVLVCIDGALDRIRSVLGDAVLPPNWLNVSALGSPHLRELDPGSIPYVYRTSGQGKFTGFGSLNQFHRLLTEEGAP